MLEDELLVRGEIGRDRRAVEVGVEQQLCLGVRVVELVLLDLHAQRLRQAAQRGLLPRTNRHGVKLRGGAQDVDEATALGALVDAPREGLDGGVADVVVRGDQTQVRGRQLDVVLDAAAAEALQALNRVLDDLGEMIAQVLVSDALQTVVVRVLGEAPVVERPGEPVHRVLLVLDGLHHDLSIHVIGHALVQVALHGQRLVDELFVILLLGVLRQQHAHTRLVHARTAGATHHLQHIVDGVVHISVFTAIELLGVHDDRQVRQHGHTPRELLCAHENLDGAGLEQAFDHCALRGGEALVEEADTVLQALLQGLLARSSQVRLHGLVGDVQEPLRLVVGGGMQQQVDGGHTRLLPVWHEDDDGLVGRVMLDGLVHWPAHGQEPRGAVVDVETLDDHLQRNGTHVGREVEKASAARSDPLTDVLRVGQRGRQRDDADGLLHLHGDVAHAADNGLQGRADVAVEQMQLVDDEEAHFLHALAGLPSAAHQVPLLRGGDHDVRLLEGLDVAGGLAAKLCDLETEFLPELVGPLVVALLCRRLVRRDVHAALDGVVAHQHPEQGELRADDLSGGRRRADQAVVVRGVERAESLRLNGVEHLEALCREEPLRIGVAQCRKRQWLQVEQLGVRRVLLGKDEVAERDRQQGLRVDPAIRDDADEVLRRQRLGDGHGEVQGVLLFGASFLQHEHLLVEDLLTVHILDEDPEGLGTAVHTRIPLEIWSDGELDHQARAGDRLHVGTQVQLRELMDKLMDSLTHLREADQLADLGTREIVVALPGEVLLLDLPQDVLGQTLEVTEGRLGAPHALVDHLAPVEGAQRQGGPTTAQADLEDRAHDAACRLLDVDHVRQEGETVQLELRDVRLQQHVHLGGRLVNASLDRNRHALHQLRHLDLLFLTHRDVLELVGQREETQQLDVGHHRLQVVVEGGDRGVLDVVVARNATQGRDLHLACALIVLDQVVLVQEHERAVHQVNAALLQKLVFFGLIGRDAV
mmetsp:Transcript_117329/g.373812  ORF Transcript_117329/g.373812 Transcript_117329/m.373812 type:complete len:986 (+) Transcript_117329:1016-3973(+)